MSPRSFFHFLLLMVAGLVLAGCAGGGGAGRYVVTAAKSPFYKYGPAQAFGADFAMQRGQKVTVVEHSFGFSKVTTDDGLSGYMPTDDLAVAPPEAAPQVRAPARTVSRTPSSRRNRAVRKPSYVEPGAPLFDVNDIPLPTDSETPKVQLGTADGKSKEP